MNELVHEHYKVKGFGIPQENYGLVYNGIVQFNNVKYESAMIDNVEVVICRLAEDNSWWIVPNWHFERNNIEWDGPHMDLEDAIIRFYLRVTPCNG